MERKFPKCKFWIEGDNGPTLGAHFTKKLYDAGLTNAEVTTLISSLYRSTLISHMICRINGKPGQYEKGVELIKQSVDEIVKYVFRVTDGIKERVEKGEPIESAVQASATAEGSKVDFIVNAKG